VRPIRGVIVIFTTTGRVSAYGKGSEVGAALRHGVTTARVPHLETVTIQVPEPGSTLMLEGALELRGGL
jgi:hypothetical protein